MNKRETVRSKARGNWVISLEPSREDLSIAKLLEVFSRGVIRSDLHFNKMTLSVVLRIF